jgi:predicted phage terminase large subunit-like protein
LNAKQQLDSFTAALRKRREQAALRRARDSFEAYIEQVCPDYKVARHHRFLIKKLEAIERGEQPRSQYSLPPQHSKTLTACLFICWEVGRNPRRKAVYVTYNDDRAQDVGRIMLRILKDDPRHRQIFPDSEVDRNAASASRIDFVKGGSVYSVSRNGGLTGRSADLLIYDDVFKDGLEAASPAIQREVIGHYTAVGLTRMAPNAPIIMFGTRWGQRDLFAYPIVERRETGWDVNNLAALALPYDPLGRPEGAALWPERFSEQILEQRRLEVGSAIFTCLYQGDPQSAAGTVFHAEHWQYFSVAPAKFKQLILVVDSATKIAATNDYTVLQVWGEISTGFYLLHNWRGRVEYVALRTKVVEFFDQWKPRWVLIEDAGSGASLIRDLDATTSLPIKRLRPDRSKIARAESITPLIESGRVYLPQTAPWLNDFLDELHAFPRGSHDDQVDCLVYALMYFRDGQGILKGLWGQIDTFTEARKANPAMDPLELALKGGHVPGVPLHKVSLADAQMAAQAEGPGIVQFKRNKHVFGDLETNRMSNNRERVPRSKGGPAQCPGCGNKNLSRYGDVQQCNVCKWDSRTALTPAVEEPPLPAPPKSEGLLDFVFGRMGL